MKKSEHIEINGFRLMISLRYFRDGAWEVLENRGGNQWGTADEPGLKVELELECGQDGWQYELSVESTFETQVRLRVALEDETELFHLIPCIIHGDNNFSKIRPLEFPLLTTERPGDLDCSPFWEFLCAVAG